MLVFEGWDAAGKGGAIRRVTGGARRARTTRSSRSRRRPTRSARTTTCGASGATSSRAGRVTIFDRSWYGRVLVERVEGFATEREWTRAYAEINQFEDQLVDARHRAA